jgi:hypothetical protein
LDKSLELDKTQEFPDVDVWPQVEQCLETDNLEQAFRLVLDAHDDLYLIKLMISNPGYIAQLTTATASELTQRYLAIQRSDFIHVLSRQFLL